MKHLLSKGRYYIGDPARIIKKNKEGDQLINQLWDVFYQDFNQFQQIKVDGLIFYMFRTEGGDGIFDGVTTDTGVLMIMNLDQIKDHVAFKQDLTIDGFKVIDIYSDTWAIVESFNLEIKGYLKIETH